MFRHRAGRFFALDVFRLPKKLIKLFKLPLLDQILYLQKHKGSRFPEDLKTADQRGLDKSMTENPDSRVTEPARPDA
ncbi:MAG: hypothetical protein WD407_01785 [Rhodospirillales bacterium]